jgi:hemolysin D
MDLATSLPTGGALRRHWQVLKESWALDSELRKSRKHWRETDFLPAALEVMERPPSPLGRVIMWTLFAFLGLALTWSILARVDVVAVASGKVASAGKNKLVQAPDGGVVRRIHVEDGQKVVRGQPLVTLDPTATGAELSQARSRLETAELDAARAQTLLAALKGRSRAFDPPAGTAPETIALQDELIASRLAELRAKVSALREQASEAEAMSAGASADVARLSQTLPFLSERVEKRRELASKGYASRLSQLELEQVLVDHRRQIDVQVENSNRARASLAAVHQQIAMARAEAVREVLADLSKARSEARLAREELTKADQRSRFQVVRSPVDGVVQQLAVYSEGAVLKPADPILVVVPDNAKLIIEAQVLNRDIGFVRAGQNVMVKLEAFPFTRYGTLDGTLTRISRDAVQDEKLGPVYQAIVAVEPPDDRARAAGVSVSPGLAATAEIKIRDRRVIDYLLSPLERRVSEAGRER